MKFQIFKIFALVLALSIGFSANAQCPGPFQISFPEAGNITISFPASSDGMVELPYDNSIEIPASTPFELSSDCDLIIQIPSATYLPFTLHPEVVLKVNGNELSAGDYPKLSLNFIERGSIELKRIGPESRTEINIRGSNIVRVNFYTPKTTPRSIDK